MTLTAIIGGTGLTRLPEFEISHREKMPTQWGEPSSDLIHGKLYGAEIVFIARHGEKHTIPPHRINYRANIKALKDTGASAIIAAAAVGGIRPDMGVHVHFLRTTLTMSPTSTLPILIRQV